MTDKPNPPINKDDPGNPNPFPKPQPTPATAPVTNDDEGDLDESNEIEQLP